MARSLERAARFTKPGRYIFNMLAFLAAVAALVYYLSPVGPQTSTLLVDAFNANPPLNGLILAVLGMGIIYNLRQAGVIAPAVRWVEAFRESADPSRTRLPRPPAIIGAMATLLLDADSRGGRLSPSSTRAILDSIGTRIDEGRELGRYIANLLVFLGLLGTFWGLLQTIDAVAGTISGLATEGGDDAAGAVQQLINNIGEPLSGMSTAFSSSLFGLGGSLVIGFLDLQAGQAQNRFYSDLEDWLSGMTDTGGRRAMDDDHAGYETGEEAASVVEGLARVEAAVARLAEIEAKLHEANTAQLKDEIRALNRTLIRVGGGE